MHSDKMSLTYDRKSNTIQLIIRDEHFSILEGYITIGHVAEICSTSDLKNAKFQIKIPQIKHTLEEQEADIENIYVIFTKFAEFILYLHSTNKLKTVEYMIHDTVAPSFIEIAFTLIKKVVEEYNISHIVTYNLYS